MSARATISAAPAVGRRDAAALLALAGGGALLVEALLAALLFGIGAEAYSPTRTALLLGVGGLVALIAARLVLTAPRLASILCLVALAPAAAAHLPEFASRLHAHYWRPLLLLAHRWANPRGGPRPAARLAAGRRAPHVCRVPRLAPVGARERGRRGLNLSSNKRIKLMCRGSSSLWERRAFGPEGLQDTCAALDPALWFFGKYGCSHCESVQARVPAASICPHCQVGF